MTRLQPFVLLRREYVQGFIKMKKIYLVSQSYRRGDLPYNDPPKEGIAFSDYEDKWQANAHYDAVKKRDKYAAIIDLSKPEHKEKVLKLIAGETNFIPYWAAVMSKEKLEKEINEVYRESIKSYLERNTNWLNGGSSNITVRPKIDLAFGELYITFKHAGETLRFKFGELDNL